MTCNNDTWLGYSGNYLKLIIVVARSYKSTINIHGGLEYVLVLLGTYYIITKYIPSILCEGFNLFSTLIFTVRNSIVK